MVLPNFLNAGTTVDLLLKAESPNKYSPAEKKSLGANDNEQLLNTRSSCTDAGQPIFKYLMMFIIINHHGNNGIV
jgi:hypothetical protein